MQDELVFMFSGQGSQYSKMGLELYEANAVFRQTMNQLDESFQALTGASVVAELYLAAKRKGSRFDDIFYSHPAIFMVQYALSQTLIAAGIRPRYVIGVSLGEYVALAVAKVLSPTHVLELIVKQVNLLQETCGKGAMIAILDNCRLYEESAELNGRTELIAVNYDKHFTVACSVKHAKDTQQFLKERNIASLKLPVNYAFHSASIDRLKEPYCDVLRGCEFRLPEISFVSSMMGGPVKQIGESFLWDVLREPMNFQGALKALADGNPKVYLDLGPSGTLENFSKKLLDPAQTRAIKSIITPMGSDMKKLNETIVYCGQLNLTRDGEKAKMKAYLFPGQGAQSVGMGDKLFQEFPEYTAIADRVLGYSIEELCLKNSKKLLDNTAYTQPALYVVNALSYLKHQQESGEAPDYVAGHSLGEYSALFAAEVFDFETGLRIVQKRGELMSTATGGGMAALIGLTEEAIREILAQHRLDRLDVANLNTPTQIALSGLQEDITAAKEIFESSGVSAYVVLNVSGAFHSRYMRDSAIQFKQFLEQFTFKAPKIPVISNLTSRPYTLKNMIHYMTEQMVSSVQWTESVRYLMGKDPEMELLQIGPGHVIAGLVSKIKREAEPLIVEDDAPSEDNFFLEAAAAVELPDIEPILEETATEEEIYAEEIILNEEAVQEAGLEQTEVLEVPANADNPKVLAGEGSPGMQLGSTGFKQRYGLDYAYVLGGMNDGISSQELVTAAGRAGCLAFLGASGMRQVDLEHSIRGIRQALGADGSFGVTVMYHPIHSGREERLIETLLREKVDLVEATSYLTMTPALIKYRILGLSQRPDGTIRTAHRIIAKVSRPDIAKMFMLPPPERIVEKLVASGDITPEQAQLARLVSIADDLCAVGDSAGPTDQANLLSLLPTMIRLRQEIARDFAPARDIHIGAAGGIGTPEAAAGVFLMGAEFILTGSINQCTVESGASAEVKDILEQLNVYDMAYVPSAELFELGGKAQVVKKGLFFSARANKLYELYRNLSSIGQLDPKTKSQLEEKYFGRTITSILEECKRDMPAEELASLNSDSKQQLAAVFKWYIENSKKSAIAGETGNKVNYSIMCGPSVGAFNQWVKGTALEAWRNRKVAIIGAKLMEEAATIVRGEIVQ
ncbi:ACP S-malonyltransferase [Paenibacillus lutimineralis]|uniref:[acyl-carrier-protein] S-malonyltransferase n=1 Tax=Paenibacillus lutimineralis TaxID=2707005 RepID=A0A3Q9I7D5_9BACL|nr:ACP S-malonyltransferase [Paenibacillus lutimineralis]AZS14164.1 [acyl-carrier-protein] S-malonyltransferase [Paenibacillus lutimineralis]